MSKLREDQLNAFYENIELLQESDCSVFLVQAPMPKFKYNRYSNNQYFDSLMSSVGEDIPYYNFSTDEDFVDKTHFYDNSHLNRWGVIRLCEKMLNIIIRE